MVDGQQWHKPICVDAPSLSLRVPFAEVGAARWMERGESQFARPTVGFSMVTFEPTGVVRPDGVIELGVDEQRCNRFVQNIRRQREVAS